MADGTAASSDDIQSKPIIEGLSLPAESSTGSPSPNTIEPGVTVVASTVEEVEADPHIADDASDSAVGFDADSMRSQSLSSSIRGYKYENGRRYHAYREGAYFLPNDDPEQARLDLIHHIFRLAVDGSLYLSPLGADIKRVLDLGTGTGIWAIDFAEEFPNAEVIGTDLSPIQPSWVPPNLKFYVDDLEEDWSYGPAEQFDFIHERSLGGSVTDWPRLVKQCYDSLKPGGWAEFQEYEGWFFSDTDPDMEHAEVLIQWAVLINKAASQFGKVFNVTHQLIDLLKDAGFVDIKQRVIHIPIGPWAKGKKAKEMGVCQREQMCDAIDSFTPMLFTRVLGWTNEECQVIQAKAKNTLRSPSRQVYTKFWYVYGRKPEH